MAEGASEKSASLVSRSRTFVSEAFDELHKVSKPSRKEAVNFTIVSIVLILFIAVCLMVLDLIFNQLMSAVLS